MMPGDRGWWFLSSPQLLLRFFFLFFSSVRTYLYTSLAVVASEGAEGWSKLVRDRHVEGTGWTLETEWAVVAALAFFDVVSRGRRMEVGDLRLGLLSAEAGVRVLCWLVETRWIGLSVTAVVSSSP